MIMLRSGQRYGSRTEEKRRGSRCSETPASAVTLLRAAVPLVEVAANENEAPRSVGRLAEVLDKREWRIYFSRRRTAGNRGKPSE